MRPARVVIQKNHEMENIHEELFHTWKKRLQKKMNFSMYEKVGLWQSDFL